MEAIFTSETSVAFNGLHGVIFQKIELFIITAVRTSDPTIAGWFPNLNFSLVVGLRAVTQSVYRYVRIDLKETV
jgi:hypothetical protein